MRTTPSIPAGVLGQRKYAVPGPFPVGLLSPVQGWISVNFTPSVNQISHDYDAQVFIWQDRLFTVLELYFASSGGDSLFLGRLAGSFDTYQFIPYGYQNGVNTTATAAWTPTQTRLSKNGAAFSNAANTTVPALISRGLSVFQFQNGLDAPIPGTVHWIAFGHGTLSNADAATLHGFGSNPPALAAVPGSCTGVWSSVTGRLELAPGLIV